MQTIDKDAMNAQGGSITMETFELISRTTGWMKFLAIMGFIGSGFLILGAFASLANPFVGPVMFIVYLIVGVIGFFPALFLMQYAVRLSDFCEQRDAGSLEMAFARQRMMFVFLGITTIIYIVVVIIAIVIAAAFASEVGHF